MGMRSVAKSFLGFPGNEVNKNGEARIYQACGYIIKLQALEMRLLDVGKLAVTVYTF
jgi:hypothetical protein